MNNRGFTLIELMIVVAILAILLSLAMPNLVESRKAANEASAVSALRTISSSQELYMTRYGVYGSLADLNSAGIIDDVLGSATAPTSEKNGYYYTVSLSPTRTIWSCVARPVSWDKSGNLNYKIDQTGVIYKNTTDGSSDWSTSLGS